MKAVVAPLERSPVVLMFDPAQHSFRAISDIGKTDTRVLYFQGATYMDYLVGSGQLKRSQVDPATRARRTGGSPPAARSCSRAS